MNLSSCFPPPFEDHGDDLWRVANVIQEHVMRGQDHGVIVGENGRRRRTSTRPVNGIEQSISLNKALWSLNERMVELKRG